MRHYQRGIATTVILIIFLLAGVAIASAAFIFFQKQQEVKEINSFEDCAKYYPVMESYPEQCNTPDGKHFVRELSKEEEQLTAPAKPSSKFTELDGQVWNDAHQIVVLVNLFYAKNQRLPDSIAEVLSDPDNSNFKLNNNPIDNQPYEYKVNKDNKSFEVSGKQSDGSVYRQVIEVN